MSSNSDAQEIARAISSAPPGTYRLYHGQGVGLEGSIDRSLRNLDEIRDRVDHALANGCYVEVISLRMQIVDLWLRYFFVNRAPEGQRREREFGRLLRQCKDLGLDQGLCSEISQFNKERINAIHGYVLGRTDYSALRNTANKSKDISRSLIAFVLRNCGEPVTRFEDQHHDVGDIIVNVDMQTRRLQDM